MDATTNGSDGDGATIPSGWRWTLPRALGVAAFLGMAVFWIWAFANGGSIPHPDEFDDPVFTTAAEQVCSPRQQAIVELGNPAAVADAEERSVLLAAGTLELEQMVLELAALAPPTDPKGADGVARWLADYELYLGDRRNYAAILATGDDPPFLISGNADGQRVTDLLTTFAEVNEMRSCAPAGDV